MFNSLEEAISLGDKKKKNDGGVPVFEWRAMPKAGIGKEDIEYEDVVWVQIFNKGDPKNIIERPKRDEDEERWPEYWKAFLEKSEPPINGIPLEDFPSITPAERMRLKSLHLRTVEDVANYPDGQIKDLGGRGYALKKAAVEFIEYRGGQGIAEMKATIEELQKQLQELKAKDGDSTTDNSKRGSGNKPAKTRKRNGRGAGSRRKSVSDSKDSGE